MRRVNYFPDPLFTRQPDAFDDCTVSATGDGSITIEPKADATAGGFIQYYVDLLHGHADTGLDIRPGTPMVLQFAGVIPEGVDDMRGPALSVYHCPANDLSKEKIAVDATGRPGGNATYTVRFAAPPEGSVLILRWRGSKTRQVTFEQPLLEPAATYDHATPLTGGGVSGSPATRVPDARTGGGR